MKSFYLKTLAVALAFSSISSAAVADTGNGSGNGDGDRAFALQKLATANPGLTPAQVLLKAFQESAGRIPVIKYSSAMRAPEGYVYNNYKGFLFGSSADSDSAPGSHGIEFAMRDGREVGPTSVGDTFSILKMVPKLGPLLQPQDGNLSYSLLGRDNERHMSTSGAIRNTGRGLVFQVDYVEKASRLGTSLPWVELRSYNPTTVIYVIHAFPLADGSSVCRSLNPYDLAFNVPESTDICAVGYFWK